MAGWAGLPSELLFKIQYCSSVDLRGVCRTWKDGLEGGATSLTVRGPSTPMSLAQRFHSLANLDLSLCGLVTHEFLRSLEALPLSSLDLRVDISVLTAEIVDALRLVLPLGELRLHLKTPWAGAELQVNQTTNINMWLLEGLPVTHMTLVYTGISDLGLAAMRGLPIATLCIHTLYRNTISDAGMLVGLQGMPLSTLDLSGYVSTTCTVSLSGLSGLFNFQTHNSLHLS